MTLYKMVLIKLKTVRFLNSLQALREERGAIFVLTAILLPVLLGGMGFAYDVGNLYMHKARLQNAADAASLAGARAFVDEAATQRKTLRTQYMNNNNVTTIPSDKSAEINETVKAEAKTAAKTAAVANVGKNMVNLHNNNYQSEYFLITGRITESGKNYEQQYFKANLKETVPLFFIPVLLDLKEQEVAAEAISTIINKATGKSNNSNTKEKFGPDSLFMVKEAIYADGNSFYDNGDTPKTDDSPKAPTWTGFMDGNLRYTGGTAPTILDSNPNRYEGKEHFDRVFNSKALNLMSKLKALQTGFDQAKYDAFLAEFVTHPDFCTDAENRTFTTKGRDLFNRLETLTDPSKYSFPNRYDKSYWAVYNAFYDELSNNKNYYRTFEKLEGYDMDKLGEAIKSLFKSKLQTESNQTDEEINKELAKRLATWETQEANWKILHDKWLEDKAKAQEDAAKEIARLEQEAQTSGNSANTPYTLQEAANILKTYHNMYVAYANNGGNIWDETIKSQVWAQYVADNKPFGIKENEINNYLGGNWLEPDPGWTWANLPSDKWQWNGIRTDYEVVLGVSLTGESSDSGIPTLEQLMQEWLQNNPEPQEPIKPKREDIVTGSNGDEYYAQYNGQQQVWLASEISKIPPSKEHKFFYYNNAINFTLNIDKFYEDENVTGDDPFYIYIGDNSIATNIQINLQADMNRPLVFCYIGSKDNFKNPNVYVNLNGHTFKGIIYTPNSYGNQNIHLQNGGSFRGTWMSKSLGWQDAKTGFAYEEFK